MSLSRQPYEEPRGGDPAPEMAGAVPSDTAGDLGPPPLPPLPNPPPASVPVQPDAVLALMQQLATYEREIFTEALAGMYQRFDQRLDEALADVHDPTNAQFRGILIGGAAVAIALVTLLIVGLLFLFGVRNVV